MRLLLITCIFLAGCTGSATVDNDKGVVSNSGGDASVALITLKDGTKCAVLIGMYKGALSCDWRNN